MTTKVLIVNHGPDDVLISVMDIGDLRGKTGAQHYIRPTESYVGYVYGMAALQIEEMKKEPKEP